jgi:hypothetical protein
MKKEEIKDNYIPYGEEWKNELMKLSKVHIISLYRMVCLACKEFESELALFKKKLVESIESPEAEKKSAETILMKYVPYNGELLSYVQILQVMEEYASQFKFPVVSDEESQEGLRSELMAEIKNTKAAAINNQFGWQFPNEHYIEASGIILACNHLIEYLESQTKQK